MSIITDLEQQITVLREKIKAIQDKCSHPKECVNEKCGGNTGNYDPTADCYWTDYHCSLCDKKWTVYKE